MNTSQLREEIEKYNKFTDYLAETAIVGTRIGFVRALIEKAQTKPAAPPDMHYIQLLVDVAADTSTTTDLRAAINIALSTIADLQGQVRGMQIERAEEQRRNSFSEAVIDAQVKQEA